VGLGGPVGEVGEVMEDGAREGPGVVAGHDGEGIYYPFLVAVGVMLGGGASSPDSPSVVGFASVFQGWLPCNACCGALLVFHALRAFHWDCAVRFMPVGVLCAVARGELGKCSRHGVFVHGPRGHSVADRGVFRAWAGYVVGQNVVSGVCAPWRALSLARMFSMSCVVCA
jgi:hypothetical protein